MPFVLESSLSAISILTGQNRKHSKKEDLVEDLAF